MRITTKFIGSSLAIVGLVASLLISGDFFIRKAEETAQANRSRHAQAINIILRLNISLNEQVKSLKDIILLGREAVNLARYQKALSEFTDGLNELDRLMPEVHSELPVIRRRHNLVIDLATELTASKPTEKPLILAQSQQDFRTINSFETDIKLYLDFLSDRVQKQDAIANQNFERFKQTAEAAKQIIIVIILLVYIGQLLLILLPVIRSIQQLQLGAAKLGAGNLDYRLNIQTKDEIEQLANAFNHMAIALTESYHSLELKKQVADAANHAKSEFLANMSHELRTPLNGILGYAQILHRDKNLTPKQQEGLGIIQQCGSHLLTLINDILDLSKIEARRMELYPNDFHFPAFLQAVGEICRIKADQKQISFVYQPSSELPTGIRADEKRLRQVLINLLGNAIKFTDQGGVTFTVEELKNEQKSHSVSFSNSQKNLHKIRFQITDTGVGMSPHQLQKIFLPFEQVGNSKKQSEGTGLGLAISQTIVQMMGSAIQVKSELGQGSIFWIDLELPEATDWAHTATVLANRKVIGYRGKKQKILVVDDKWENRSVISNLLEGIGIEIAEATNGQEGLAKLVEFEPNLLIIDLVMPVMDGFEMMRRLRNFEKFKDMLVIVSSASVFESDQYKSLEAGACDFLPKPVQVDELLNKLQKHLQLEWLYAENEEKKVEEAKNNLLRTPDSLSLATFVSPPAEELAKLLDLAKKGRLKNILEAADQLELSNKDFVPFSEEIRQLAKGFQVKRIQEFIQEQIATKSSI